MSAPRLTREQVLGHRWWAQGLDRRPGGADAVLRLGVQDTPRGSAAAALAVRDARGLDGLVTLWSWRGAPHRHRRDDAAFYAAALWPVDDADATRRIAVTRIRAGAARGIAAFTEVATAMREVVDRPVTKGEVSAAVTARVPDDLAYWCEPCAARHVAGTVFQQVGVHAGVEVATDGRGTVLRPLPADVRPPRVPTEAEGTAEALRRYLEVLGPASSGDLAAFVGTNRTVVDRVLAGGLDAGDLVRVDGPAGPAWATPDGLAAARAADRPAGTRLLPAGDPWLQARDRELIVPDAARRKRVWRPVGAPGVVLVDGEVVGEWRATTTGSGARRRLSVTVEPWQRLASGPRAAPARAALAGEALAGEAERLAAARDLAAAEVTVADR